MGNLTNVFTQRLYSDYCHRATLVIGTGSIDPSVGSMAPFNSGMMIIFMNYLVQHWGATWSTIIAAMVLSLGVGGRGGAW